MPQFLGLAIHNTLDVFQNCDATSEPNRKKMVPCRRRVIQDQSEKELFSYEKKLLRCVASEYFYVVNIKNYNDTTQKNTEKKAYFI